MASKKRGSLSKNEYKRAQAAKAVAVKKPSVKAPIKAVSSSKKAVSAPKYNTIASAPSIEAYAAGQGAKPLLNSSQQAYQAKANADFYAGKPQKNVVSYKEQKSSSSKKNITAGRSLGKEVAIRPADIGTNRELASKAFNDSSPSPRKGAVNQGSGSLFGRLKSKGIGAFTDLFGDMGELISNNGLYQAAPGTFYSPEQKGRNKQVAFDNTIGLPGVNASTKPDLPTGAGDNGETFFNNFSGPSIFTSDFATPGTNFSRPGSEEAYLRGESPIAYGNEKRDQPFNVAADFGMPANSGRNPLAEFVAPTASAGNNEQYEAEKRRDQGRDPYLENDPTLEKEMGNMNPRGLGRVMNPNQPVADYLDVDPANVPLVDTPFGTTGNRSGRGSGLFATGKGVGNPAGEDDYIKELRKSLKGYGRQEDDVMKQFEDLIKSLDPTYDEYQREGKEELDSQLNENLLKLASVMNANNTGDSEQRAQLMAGQQRTNQSLLGDLIRKLQLQKQQDISGYKSQSIDKVNEIRSKKQSAQERIAQLIRQARMEAQDREDKFALEGMRSSGRRAADNQKLRTANNKSLQTLLAKAANMTSGGDAWAKKNAPLYGLSAADVSPYLQGNWGDGFRSEPKATSTRNAASYAPDGSYTFNETDPETGLKIFYDENGNPFVNQ